MREQLRTLVFALVIVVIAASSIIETPGTVEGVGLAVVLVIMILLILRERRKPR